MRFNSSIKGKVAKPTAESASGIHSLNNVNIALKDNDWYVASLYPFAVNQILPFSVSRSITDSSGSSSHRTGPSQAEVRSWLSGTSNGGPNWGYSTYVDVPVQGYQRWTVGYQGVYEITARGAGGGGTDSSPVFHRGRGQIATARFSLGVGDTLIIVVGQGAPDYTGDHCNGAGGGSFVALGSNYTTAIPLLVGAGASGDTSDGGGNDPSTTSTSRSVTDPSGTSHTGLTTTPIQQAVSSYGTWGYSYVPGSSAHQNTVGGGFWGSSPTTGSTAQHGETFSEGLVGGTRSNDTAGYGGFGGGSGGVDEAGNSGGGFTTGESADGPASAAGGWINTGHSWYVSASAGFSLKPATITGTSTNVPFQSSDYSSEEQLNGSVTTKRVS